MSPTEIIDAQCEIIRLQSTLIRRLSACAGQIDSLDRELMRIKNLKEIIEVQHD